MTVHGAKGLEAPIVILADTTRAPKSRTDGLMSEPEAREAFPLLPGKKEDDADTPLKRLRAEAERRARAEHKRLLYVALTRAQDRLIIAGAWAGKGKDGFAADSWYALCKTAMETLYGEPAPDPDEPDGPGITRYGPAPVCLPAAPPSEVTSTTTAPPPPAWLHTPPAATTRATGFLSPSRLTRETGQARPPFAADDSTRYRRGTLIHSLLEILPDRSPDIRPEIARTLLTRAGVSDPAAIAEMTNAALRVLDDPAIASVFAPGSRAEVAVVGRVDDGLGGALRVAGRVDRLAVSPTEILIVDFKTDRPPPASLEALDPAYLVQMAAYRGVLANAWPGRAIVCALLWTEGPRLMILPDDAMTAAFTLSRAQLRTGPDTLSA
jgi:ATP-dependent helicase/nuclease subunit A